MLSKALITGITGKDGSYLAELLLAKGYEVHGIKRRSSSFNTERIDGILPDLHDRSARLFLHFGDLNDSSSLIRLLLTIRPSEVYHLGSSSRACVGPEWLTGLRSAGEYPPARRKRQPEVESYSG